MQIIGITGGVGSGKSKIANYVRTHFRSRILYTDRIAHELMRPGSACYDQLKPLFDDPGLFLPDGSFDRGKLADVLFADEKKREAVNAIVHPAVDAFVKDAIAKEQEAGKYDAIVIESALLLEAGYDAICDEVWYVYASEETRRKRLASSRGYDQEKMDAIMASQRSEEDFRARADEVIDNDRSPDESYSQVFVIMHRKGFRQFLSY